MCRHGDGMQCFQVFCVVGGVFFERESEQSRDGVTPENAWCLNMIRPTVSYRAKQERLCCKIVKLVWIN